jgi:hypothetical protein
MSETTLSKSDRWVIGLLAAITVLLVLLLAGLGVGAWVLTSEYHRLEAALGAQSRSLTAQIGTFAATAKEVSHETTRRQDVLGDGLVHQSRLTLAKVRELEGRRRSLTPIPKGPLEKLDRSIQLNQLMSDELLLLLTHLAETQATLGERTEPLPAQKKAEARH